MHPISVQQIRSPTQLKTEVPIRMGGCVGGGLVKGVGKKKKPVGQLGTEIKSINLISQQYLGR